MTTVNQSINLDITHIQIISDTDLQVIYVKGSLYEASFPLQFKSSRIYQYHEGYPIFSMHDGFSLIPLKVGINHVNSVLDVIIDKQIIQNVKYDHQQYHHNGQLDEQSDLMELKDSYYISYAIYTDYPETKQRRCLLC
jgi:hypothetical protein